MTSANQIQNGLSELRRLHQAVLPFILRREKSEVLKELPDKLIHTKMVQMSTIQRELYERIIERNSQSGIVKILHGIEGDIQSIKDKSVLRTLLHLRLVCSHPCLVLQAGTSNDKKLSIENNIAFSQAHVEISGKLIALYELLRDTLDIKSNSIGKLGVDGDDSTIFVDSALIDTKNDEMNNVEKEELNETTETIHDLKEVLPSTPSPFQISKCLVFAHFTQSLDVIENGLFCSHLPSLRYLRLDGKVSPADRGKVVDQFNSDQSIRVLLLTTKVGGLGLNLTAADTVIFFECDWNPHVDLQAMDRVHRLGQKSSSINIYRLVTENSIEERIMQKQKVKIDMSNAIVNTDNSTLFSMGTDRLLDIYSVNSAEAPAEKLNSGEFQNDDADWIDEQLKTNLTTNDFMKSL